MRTDTPRTDACPHCGCQTKDPFGMGKTIHNVANCKRNRQLAEAKAEIKRLRGQLQQAVEIAEVFESELDEYHSVDRNCPDAAWHYPDGWERSAEAKDKLEALNKETLNQTNK